MPAPRSVRKFGWLLVAVEGVVAVFLVYQLQEQPLLMLLALAPLLVGAVVAAFLLTSSIDVIVRPDGATITFAPLYRRTIQPQDVSHVRLRDVIPSEFGGVGLRRGPGQVTALLWGAGPGVEVQERDGSRTVVATSEAPQLHRALQQMTDGPGRL